MRYLFGFLLRWLPVTLPAVMLVVFLAIPAFARSMPEWCDSAAFQIMPYIMFGACFLMGTHFAQSKVSFLSMLLAAMTMLLDRSAFGDDPNSGRTSALVLLSSLYLPPLTAAFYQLSERGFLTPYGYLRIAVVFLAVVILLLLPGIPAFSDMLDGSGPFIFRTVDKWIEVPMIGFVVLFFSVPFLSIRNEQESPHLGPLLIVMLLFVFSALNFRSSLIPDGCDRAALSLFMTGGGAVMFWGLLDSSWRSANVDELTDLPGRRALRHHMARLGRQYVLAVLDIDHFKRINDEYGHDTGDQVLRYIAFQLKKMPVGLAYRFGGEEFVIIMEEINRKDAVDFLEDMRVGIKSRGFGLRGSDRPAKQEGAPVRKGKGADKVIIVTVSIGVADSGKGFTSPQDVLEAADKAMYQAKKDGRNRLREA